MGSDDTIQLVKQSIIDKASKEPVLNKEIVERIIREAHKEN